MKPDTPHSHHPQPVAYDVEGRPLYHHPPVPVTPAHHGHQPVQQHQPATEQTKQRHNTSRQRYSDVELHESEYVITMVRRHPVGLFYIWAAETFAIVALLAAWLYVAMDPTRLGDMLESSSAQLYLGLAFLALLAFLLLIGWIGTIIYRGNRFIVTNQRVIQYIMTGLFAKKRQVISMSRIEDASYHQTGILQHIIGYGSIRLSTVGDETTYRFNLVAQPRRQMDRLNQILQAVKHGRPIADELIDQAR